MDVLNRSEIVKRVDILPSQAIIGKSWFVRRYLSQESVEL